MGSWAWARAKALARGGPFLPTLCPPPSGGGLPAGVGCVRLLTRRFSTQHGDSLPATKTPGRDDHHEVAVCVRLRLSCLHDMGARKCAHAHTLRHTIHRELASALRDLSHTNFFCVAYHRSAYSATASALQTPRRSHTMQRCLLNAYRLTRSIATKRPTTTTVAPSAAPVTIVGGKAGTAGGAGGAGAAGTAGAASMAGAVGGG